MWWSLTWWSKFMSKTFVLVYFLVSLQRKRKCSLSRLRSFNKGTFRRCKIWRGSMPHKYCHEKSTFQCNCISSLLGWGQGREFDWFIFTVYIPEHSHLLSEFLFVTLKFHIYDVTTCFSLPSLGIVLENENNTKVLPSPPCFALLISMGNKETYPAFLNGSSYKRYVKCSNCTIQCG